MEVAIPNNLPVLVLRDLVAFPYHVIPLIVGREKSLAAISHAIETERLLMVVAQKDASIMEPSPEDLYATGAIGEILRVIKAKNGNSIKVLIQVHHKAQIIEFCQYELFFDANIEICHSPDPISFDLCQSISTVKEKLDKLIITGTKIPYDILAVLENLEDGEKLVHLIAANIGLDVHKAQAILELQNPNEKINRLTDFLDEKLKNV